MMVTWALPMSEPRVSRSRFGSSWEMVKNASGTSLRYFAQPTFHGSRNSVMVEPTPKLAPVVLRMTRYFGDAISKRERGIHGDGPGTDVGRVRVADELVAGFDLPPGTGHEDPRGHRPVHLDLAVREVHGDDLTG